MKFFTLAIVTTVLLSSLALTQEKPPVDGTRMCLKIRVMEQYEGRPGKPAGPRPVTRGEVPLNALNSRITFDGKTVGLTWELLDDQTAKIYVTLGELKESFDFRGINDFGLEDRDVIVVAATAETMRFGDSAKLDWPDRHESRGTWLEFSLARWPVEE